MYILDVDDTLFCTHAYKHARQQALVDCGVSLEHYTMSYEQARSHKSGVVAYTNAYHAHILASFGYEEATILRALENIDQHMPSFLFEDTISFLKLLKTHHKPIIVLSLGEQLFQQKKIQESGIATYADAVYITNTDKRHIISDILSRHTTDDPIWFVNDKIQETQDIIDAYPHMHPILKQGDTIPVEQYIASAIPYKKTLTEIYTYITTYI